MELSSNKEQKKGLWSADKAAYYLSCLLYPLTLASFMDTIMSAQPSAALHPLTPADDPPPVLLSIKSCL